MEQAMIEKGSKLMLDFGKIEKAAFAAKRAMRGGFIPVVVQDAISNEVLLIAYTNQEAFEYLLREGIAAFWSTSRDCLWVKGKTTGCFLKLREVRVNCEQNSLLYLVERTGKRGACHVLDEDGAYYRSCFYRRLEVEVGN